MIDLQMGSDKLFARDSTSDGQCSESSRVIRLSNVLQRFAHHYGYIYFTLPQLKSDGVITDLDSTIRSIVQASFLPISIIIVGVGQADFRTMNVLDADTEPLKADGMVCQRDIVQFVAMRDMTQPGSSMVSGTRLAKEVLAELPNQLLAYFNTIKLFPPSSAT
jgi:hypothetical protein